MGQTLFKDFPDKRVSIVGMGYVGLTLAVVMADVGFEVEGTEVRDDVLEMLENNTPHFAEMGLENKLKSVRKTKRLTFSKQLKPTHNASVYIITVGTPLDKNGQVCLDMISSAAQEVAEVMDDDSLIILRSTVKIGTARKVITPILEQSGKTFEIAVCPERTLEGAALDELRKNPQIISAENPATLQRASLIFGLLTPTIIKVSRLETGELIKLVDNTYRDVSFAFANEVAKICDTVGVSANEVIQGGKLGYTRTNVAMPGLVGGPCLEKDPHILRESLLGYNVDINITASCRAQNEAQPAETVSFIHKLLLQRGNVPEKPVIVLAGLAFKGKPETDDLRGSMAIPVLKNLKEKFPNAELRGFDPVVKAREIKNLGLNSYDNLVDALDGANLLVIVNNHKVFEQITLEIMFSAMPDRAIIYDYWGNFPPDSNDESGDRCYVSLGNHCFATTS